METYLTELGERVVAFLNGGIDRNIPDVRYLAGWTVEDWRFRVLHA